MIALVEEKRAELEQLCREYAVTRLELFGSAAREDFDPEKSDLDFLVEFVRPIPMGAFHQYFGLMHSLEDLFQRKVDLVELKGVENPYVRQSIEASRRLIYGA